jgi:hypothetical protein
MHVPHPVDACEYRNSAVAYGVAEAHAFLLLVKLCKKPVKPYRDDYPEHFRLLNRRCKYAQPVQK